VQVDSSPAIKPVEPVRGRRSVCCALVMVPYEPGSRIGDYELLERLGRGGMGEVWLARSAAADAPVAIKVLYPRPDRRAEATERFEREVSAAARIGHPAIVRVHGFGADPTRGTLYLVMERLEGMSLRAWLARPEADVRTALELVRALLEPLAAAHACIDERGRPAPIVHRDLKPENALVLDRPDDGGPIKLLDFGIARQVGALDVTETGVGMGTASYMSPEQATDARDVGPSADVWSIGVMLYEILAGRLPFEAPSRNEILAKILTRDPVPLARVAPHVPRALASLVAACLAKDPARRPPDARALASELDAVLADPRARARLEARVAMSSEPASTAPTRSEPATRSRSRPRALAIAAVALAALGAIVALAWPSEREPIEPEPTPMRAAPPAPPELAPEEPNRWIRVEAGPHRLGVADDALDAAQSGFRPRADVPGPSAPYAMQQHEVTWGELEARVPDAFARFGAGLAWLPSDAAERARYPATGVPFEVALEHCRSLGGALPTEAQWEHAARGDARRPYPWGADPVEETLDAPAPVMTRAHDRTPHDPPIHDLAGNAREWTIDLWRDDAEGVTQPWADEDGRTFRAVRGLPLAVLPRWRPPVEAPLAHRIPLCATGPCPSGTDEVRRDVGFRCVR
jgi:serine/threonine protein kinase